MEITLPCVYCGNPRPDISFGHQSVKSTSFSIPKIFTYAQEKRQNTQHTPFISCKLCGKEYLLFAIRNEIEFINNFLKMFVIYTDDFVDVLKYYGFTEDIPHYVTGLTKPISSSNEIHLIIDHPNGKCYIRCVKRRNKYIAINIEKVGII